MTSSSSDTEVSVLTEFSVVERLAAEQGAHAHGAGSQGLLVQELYQGPAKCQCCINWVDERPWVEEPTEPAKDEDADETGPPLVIRHWVNKSQAGSLIAIHSIEVRSAAVRKILHGVFRGFDGLVSKIKYLVIKAPFRPFFWRWTEFEAAIAREQDASVRGVLDTLRAIVRRDLSAAFAAQAGLVAHGVIDFKNLWTILKPGEVMYSRDRLYVLEGASFQMCAELVLGSVGFSGKHFQRDTDNRTILAFEDTMPITNLSVFPVSFHPNRVAILARLLERGRKFARLAGTHYMSYCDSGEDDDDTDDEIPDPTEKTTRSQRSDERRIMIDAGRHPLRSRGRYLSRHDDQAFSLFTNHIAQAPLDQRMSGPHIPLPDNDNAAVPGPRRPANYPPGPPGYRGPNAMIPRPKRRAPEVVRGPRYHGSSSESSDEDDDEKEISSLERQRRRLTDLQLQLCDSEVLGYCLKDKKWTFFDVDKVRDIEWNTAPFENLVLPEGYKDLILAFVESQVKEKDTFEDLINGKGGGLTILLSGEPGVGKTLTAESVAEKFHVPLYKLELGEGVNNKARARARSSSSSRSRSNSRGRDTQEAGSEDFITAFDLASRWGAVLLIDECDLYLEKRSELTPDRNRVVSTFLRELEYYPSLLFLTTNRERALDPAVYSRIHLTINYPALDHASRLEIWKTFLSSSAGPLGPQGPSSLLSAAELAVVASVEVNGRRIRNIAKTAAILARRERRAVCFDDLKKVLRITEGVVVERPAAPGEAPGGADISDPFSGF